MSIKTKLVTAATAVTVMAGVAVAGTLTANAATPKCGATCSDFYSGTTGTAFVLAAPRKAGQPVTLARADRARKGEDFSVDALGTVHDFYRAGLLAGGLDKLYSGLFVYEIEYTPGAAPSDLCLGTARTPRAGTPVALELRHDGQDGLDLRSPEDQHRHVLRADQRGHQQQLPAPVRADLAEAGRAAGDRAPSHRHRWSPAVERRSGRPAEFISTMTHAPHGRRDRSSARL